GVQLCWPEAAAAAEKIKIEISNVCERKIVIDASLALRNGRKYREAAVFSAILKVNSTSNET
ncbi:hypothetical protein OFO30_37290, partial [Escherichia coli]|nr:hypothetical protein [Escherichia coli]